MLNMTSSGTNSAPAEVSNH